MPNACFCPDSSASVSIFSPLEAIRWAWAWSYCYSCFYSIFGLRATQGSWEERNSSLPSQTYYFLKRLRLSCSDDKPFRVAHPILESSGAGPDILVSTLIAAPALSGTDSPDSYLDQGPDGLCRLSLLSFVHTLLTLLPATCSNFLIRKANYIEGRYGTVKDVSCQD